MQENKYWKFFMCKNLSVYKYPIYLKYKTLLKTYRLYQQDVSISKKETFVTDAPSTSKE